MSAQPQQHSQSDQTSSPVQASATPRPVTMTRLNEMKALGEPIAMVTAYDYPSATVVDEAGVDVVLVGDSAAMVVLGYRDTTPVTMDEMVMLASAVRRGLNCAMLVGDMPFGSYEASDELAVTNAQRFVKEAGCDAVKLERGGSSATRAKAIIEAGIPVMAHVGLTPQSAVQLGGYRAQGRTAAQAKQVIEDALNLQAAGCFAIVLEAVPSELTAALMPLLEIPAIGIGAGPAADGQVLVYHDLLGIWGGRAAKFVKRYANVREQMVTGVAAYTAEVRERAYPGPEHQYQMAPDEATELAEWTKSLPQAQLQGSRNDI
ncbi:MAG: 3-methyl-2-oxobutanoate hydroxymethyltransferase [Thermoleophilaceae bacterium]|nr:3-methyl-2-oxobutanoate hydroxymethyltransferase [Thermoleophilaceae bacterium]